MIRPAKIFQAAVKHQAEQNKKQAGNPAEGAKNTAPAAESAGEKKAKRRVPSVRPKIGTLL